MKSKSSPEQWPSSLSREISMLELLSLFTMLACFGANIQITEAAFWTLKFKFFLLNGRWHLELLAGEELQVTFADPSCRQTLWVDHISYYKIIHICTDSRANTKIWIYIHIYFKSNNHHVFWLSVGRLWHFKHHHQTTSIFFTDHNKMSQK